MNGWRSCSSIDNYPVRCGSSECYNSERGRETGKIKSKMGMGNGSCCCCCCCCTSGDEGSLSACVSWRGEDEGINDDDDGKGKFSLVEVGKG